MRTFAEKSKAAQQTKSSKSTMPARTHLGQNRGVSSILHFQRMSGNQAEQWSLRSNCEERNAGLPGPALPHLGHSFSQTPVTLPLAGPIQMKLAINEPGDVYEQEADRVAEQVMRMPEPELQRACACGGKCPKCRAEHLNQERELLQTKRDQASKREQGSAPPIVHEVIQSPGLSLDSTTRAFMEPRFGRNFSEVRVHADTKAAESAQAVNALAYTVGNDVAFGSGQYAPRKQSGLQLLAHELAHVVQQTGARERGPLDSLMPVSHPGIQRTLGDGHDLTSGRFSRILDLEAAYDDELLIREGSSGRGVQAIQQALYDLGFPLSAYGADGKFGSETKAAVKAFQRANPPLNDDGVVGPLTMTALETRFAGTPTLPPAASRSARWDADAPAYTCIRSILCPWSPHTIDVLRTRITLKSFDSISWADEEWNGATWIPAPFPGGGYNTGTEIGVVNTSCEEMAQTLYHEVLHAEQPTTHSTTSQKESYAYRIGEEFSIAMGLGGRPSLRSTDPQGREYADPTKVNAFVATTYPSVPAGGGGDEIIGKAATHGHVRVQRPNGSIYTRPAAVGEKVPGPMTAVNQVTHPTTGWTCP